MKTSARALADCPGAGLASGNHPESPLPFGVGIPYEIADCAELTVMFLAHRGIRASNPERRPQDWVRCTEEDALAVTYRKRRHIAPIFGDGYVIETRLGRRSHLVKLSRLRARDLEFWRPR